MKFARDLLPLACLISLFALPCVALADEAADAEAPTRTIDRWLALGPGDYPVPAFHDDAFGGVESAALLDADPLSEDTPDPAKGRNIFWFDGSRLTWHEREAKEGLVLWLPTEASHQMGWLATYLDAPRYLELKVELTGSQPRRLWLDGEALAKAGLKEDGGSATETLKLEPGKHLLMIQAVRDASREGDWNLGAVLSGDGVEELELSLQSERHVELRDILDAPRIGSLALSSDGLQVATVVRRSLPGSDDRESWIEMRDTQSGMLIRRWQQPGAGRLAWSPRGRYFSYVADSPGKGKERGVTLYLFDLNKQTTSTLMRGVQRLGSYRWLPNGKGLVYSTSVEATKDERGVKRLEGLQDRWSSFRDKSYLNLITVPQGIKRQLTAGERSTDVVDIALDSRRMLFTRRFDEPATRPYSRTELWQMDLTTLQSEKLRDFRWFGSAAYAPTGPSLLVSAQPAEFGEAGVATTDGEEPNAYDTQLFIWTPGEQQADPITRDFNPAVRNADWTRSGIYLTATDEDRASLYRYHREARRFDRMESGFDVVNSWRVAHAAASIVLTASSSWQSQGLVAIDVAKGTPRRLTHPADDWFASVSGGEVHSWEFESKAGRRVDGRYYLPPNFDRDRKYPLIVYYYGGTFSVNRAFGGRYPKEWWAANGYVVYVPQPAGATGYGQDDSAIHANDWGKTSSEEIIEGTRRFISEHRFVDRKQVGCIGASYGGFMTMLLSTKSDIFSAAVAHAGISSISSYWGEGYWGYSYSAVASRDSFPWNRPDLYVEQSPLFRADKLQVPLLLTHGTGDTNVPVGESDQFYVAAKLLGKEIEYLQFDGQNHWIVDPAKRRVWSNSIVAWFDRQLKGQPEWWDALYPERTE